LFNILVIYNFIYLMKIILTILIFLISLIKLRKSENFYSESQESVLKRLKWNKSFTQSVTKGKVDLEYNKERGIFCQAKTDIPKKQFVFKIPKEFLICTCKLSLIKIVDMFPFKFEIQEAIENFFKVNQVSPFELTITQPLIPLTAIYLMYLDLANHDTLNKDLKELGYNHYIIDKPSNSVKDYLSNLPKVMYILYNFEKEEYVLLDSFGIIYPKKLKTRLMYDGIIKVIELGYPHLKVLSRLI
jgi:hypothetical protein